MNFQRPTVSQSGTVTPGQLVAWAKNKTVLDIDALPTDIHGLRVSYAKNVDFNSANTDTAIALPLSVGVTGYRVHGVRISGATAAINSSTCGVFTQPNGTGVAVVASGTPVTVTQTAADTNNNMQSLTIANQDLIAFGDTTLYFRVQTPQGSSAKANVSVAYELLDITSTVSKYAPPPPPFPIFGTVSSAGVFDATGALVRTLWSAVANNQFVTNPAAAWDGRLDNGSVAPSGIYTVQTLSSNTTYAWEGVVGNTKSDAASHTVSINPVSGGASQTAVHTSSYHAHAGGILDLCVDGSNQMWFTSGYDERFHTFWQATTADPNTNNTVVGQSFRSTFAWEINCCTDGITAYFSDNDRADGVDYIWGFTCSLPHTNALLTGGTFNGFIWTVGQMTDPGDASSYINDIAVQSGGSINNILFLCRQTLSGGTISTFTKLGAPLQNFTGLTYPYRIEASPTNNDVWVLSRNVTATFPAYAVVNLRFNVGNAVTMKFTAASFTYTAPSGYSALNGTLDPTKVVGGMTLSGGNLSVASTTTGQDNYVYSQNAVTKGYFEMVVTADPGAEASNELGVGISSTTGTTHNGYIGNDSQSIGFFNNNNSSGGIWGPGGGQRLSLPAGYTTGDNLGVAFDTARGLIWVRKNGTSWNSGGTADPATGLGGVTLNGIAAPTLTPVITKLTVNSGGTLTTTGVTISSVVNPFDLAISPDGLTLLVNDTSAASQQVKAFNTSDGSVKTAFGTSGVFGTAGGYVNSPAVTNTKFNFIASPLGEAAGFPVLAYAPDASFWVNDVGNCRCLHFSSGNSPTYIEQIAYLPLFYANNVCYNDDTRVFVNYLEFKIDYTKPLVYGNGSWTLVNNWDYTSIAGFDQYNGLKFIGTFSNGRTYGRLPNYHIYELTSSGLRNTGVSVPPDVYIDRQFNLWTISGVTAGSSVVYKQNALTGFDGSGNPTFQTNPAAEPTTTILTSQVLPALFPQTGGTDGNLNPNLVEPLANGVIPVFNPSGQGSGQVVPFNNHVGGIDSSSGLVKFSTQPVSPQNVGANFLIYPESPYFDTRPGVFVGGPNIWKPGATDFFTSYDGENFGNNQTNMWYHWHQSGLLINRFGVSAPYFGISTFIDGSIGFITAANIDAYSAGTFFPTTTLYQPYSFKGLPGFGGNARWGGIAYQNGAYFIYHNDEWYHGGLHRWRVDNLSSVKLGAPVTVNWNSASYVPPTPGPPDLLATLPYNQTNLPNNTAGWTRSPTSDVAAPSTWQVFTNSVVASPFESPDINILAVWPQGPTPPANNTLTRSWTRSGSGNWQISATVIFNTGDNPNGGGFAHFLYLDILDATGKKIIRLQNSVYNAGASNYLCFFVNTTPSNFPGNPIRTPLLIGSGPGGLPNDGWTAYINAPQQLILNANVGAGTIQVTYGDYTITITGVLDVGADMTSPSALQISVIGASPGYSAALTISKLIFTG